MQAADGDRSHGRGDAGGGAARRSEGREGAIAPPYRMVFPEGRDPVTAPGPVRGASSGRPGKPKVETIHPDATYL
jgi:hypothetical protein